MLSRRDFMLAALAGLAGVTTARRASATLARALTLPELLYQSTHAFVGTPTDARSQWETVGDRSRIVTYTVVRVESSLDGRPPSSSELLVRTLGGVVGDIGQIVPGEAMLRRSVSAAVFVEPLSKDCFGVTGMTQGHYPLRSDEAGVRRLRADLTTLKTVQAESAVQRLDGRTLVEAERILSEELARGAR
jgi:hypothetical protein